MVKKLSKYILFIVFFMLALVYLFPKNSAYFLLEKELQKNEIIVSNELIKDKGFVFYVYDATIYFNSIKVLKFTSLKSDIFLYYNKIYIKDIELSSLIASFLPTKIDDVKLLYTIQKPLSLLLNAKGDFGTAKAVYNLQTKKFLLNLKPSPLMKRKYKRTLLYFKKNNKGEYNYEQAL